MGRQPNIELEISDLPRPTASPGVPRRWSPRRPGDFDSPGDVPWGGAYGTAGPDTGYVLRLLADRDIRTIPGESHHSAEAAVAAIAGARASHFGRAPIGEDVDVAMLLLGYDRDGIDESLIAEIETHRVAWVANVGHDAAKARELVASVPLETLAMAPDGVRARMTRGDRLLQR